MSGRGSADGPFPFEPEFAAPDERLADFCLWDYPPAAPTAGRLRASNLLLNSLPPGEAGRRGAEMLAALRRELGDGRTVWGIKRDAGGRISWELYFYDYAREGRSVSVPRVLGALSPWLECRVPARERVPYFMFSLDLDEAALAPGGRIAGVDLYLGNPGSQVSSGICYGLAEDGPPRLKNFYFFFDAARERDAIAGKIESSMWLDAPAGFDLRALLRPELATGCTTIVVANKPDRDGLYFTRLPVAQLAWFLDAFGYPPEQAGYVRRNAALLDHLRFDVGFDYRVEAGRPVFVKSAWYACI